MTTEKAIKLKSGETLPAGLPVLWLPRENSGHALCSVAGRRVRITSAFHAPDMEELEEANNDGACPSIAGNSVEPDGFDHEGSPSWLLALGII